MGKGVLMNKVKAEAEPRVILWWWIIHDFYSSSDKEVVRRKAEYHAKETEHSTVVNSFYWEPSSKKVHCSSWCLWMKSHKSLKSNLVVMNKRFQFSGGENK